MRVCLVYFSAAVPNEEVTSSSGLLADGAQIYVEAAVHEEEPVIPTAWTLRKDKQAGAVRYRLFVHSG